MFAVQPASANTYSFVMPVSALEIRLDASFGGNPQLYGFYDLYIRPKITADGTDNDGTTGNIIVDFSLRADDAPITPRGTQDAWSANITTRSGLPNFYFSAAAPGDAYIALITPNAAVAGKTFAVGSGDSRIGEQLPDSANFVLTLDSDTSITLGTPVRFEFSAFAYRFSDVTLSKESTKGTLVSGYIDLDIGPELPEPMPALTGGGGLLLLFGLAGMRRWRKTS
jgi:hypothetical protein